MNEGDSSQRKQQQLILCESAAVSAVRPACIADVTLAQDALVEELVHMLDVARKEEELLRNDDVDLGLGPPATGCGFLIDEPDTRVRRGRLTALVTTRDLVANMVDVESYGSPLRSKTPLIKIATPAERVYALRPDATVNFLVHSMIPTGHGYRYVPCVDRNGIPLGVFQLKDVLAYGMQFLSETSGNEPIWRLSLGGVKNCLVEPEDSLQTAITRMNNSRRRCIFVVESMDAPRLVPAGIIGEWDLIHGVLKEGLPLSTSVCEIMTKTENVTTCGLDTGIRKTAEAMLSANRHQLMVTCDGYLVGVVSLRRILDYVAGNFPEAIRCIDPNDPDANRFGDHSWA